MYAGWGVWGGDGPLTCVCRVGCVGRRWPPDVCMQGGVCGEGDGPLTCVCRVGCVGRRWPPDVCMQGGVCGEEMAP